MDDIIYNYEIGGENTVTIKSEKTIPMSEFSNNQHGYDIHYDIYRANFILSVYDNDKIKIVKNIYSGCTGDVDINQLIEIFSDLIIKKVSTNIEFFDDSLKSKIENTIKNILEENKLMKDS